MRVLRTNSIAICYKLGVIRARIIHELHTSRSFNDSLFSKTVSHPKIVYIFFNSLRAGAGFEPATSGL